MLFYNVTKIIGNIIKTITLAFLVLHLYEYNSSYNISAENTFGFTFILLSAFLFAIVLFLLPATLDFISLVKKNNPSLDPLEIKKDSSYNLKLSVFEIILLAIIKKDTVYFLMMNFRSVNTSLAEFGAELYQICRIYVLIIVITTLIESIIGIYILKKQGFFSEFSFFDTKKEYEYSSAPFCKYCGNILKNNAKFCDVCGRRIENDADKYNL
ncbi:MAG: zinc ribbon domain-containing protein [Ruminococcaceae bacterium]|nr:zinc ribbon domain-containing protein [Oscillospiraceae bacterium]